MVVVLDAAEHTGARGGPADEEVDEHAARDRTVAASAAARLDELVGHLHAAVVAEVPAYGADRGPGERRDIEHGIRFTAELFLATVSEERRPSRAEKRAVQRIGAQRFRQGVQPEDLLTTLEVARQAGYRFLLTLIPPAWPVDVAVATAGSLADRLSRFIPIVAGALAEGYRAAQSQPVVDGHARAVLVDRVLERRWSEVDEVVEHGRRVGMDLTRDWGVLFVLPSGAGWSPVQAARAVGEVVGEAVAGQPRSHPHPHLPVLIRPCHEDGWDALPGRLEQAARLAGLVIVYGERCDPLGPRAALWQHADPVLRFARVAPQQATVVPLHRLAHVAMLSAAPPAERMAFVQRVLTPVLADVRLIDTVRAMYEAEDSSVDAITSRLACHKNTLYQRLGKIKRATGLDLAVPADRHELFNAFLVWRGQEVELDDLDEGTRAAPA